jgi:hypothetical protein
MWSVFGPVLNADAGVWWPIAAYEPGGSAAFHPLRLDSRLSIFEVVNLPRTQESAESSRENEKRCNP